MSFKLLKFPEVKKSFMKEKINLFGNFTAGNILYLCDFLAKEIDRIRPHTLDSRLIIMKILRDVLMNICKQFEAQLTNENFKINDQQTRCTFKKLLDTTISRLNELEAISGVFFEKKDGEE